MLIWFIALFFCTALMGIVNGAQKVLVLTIPKAGTHLVMKTIELIAQKEFYPFGPTVVRQDAVKELLDGQDQLFIDHIMPDYDFLKSDVSDQFAKIIFIRDLRDVVLSQVHWMQKMEMGWVPIEQIRVLNRLPFEQRVSIVMQLPDTYFGVHYFANKALEWVKNPSVLVCRFEDLVGPQGGGSRERQERSVKALAQHMGFEISQDRVEEIIDQLFGDTWTFRSGQIGGWKEHFTPRQVELFKQAMGKELIDLGYSW